MAIFLGTIPALRKGGKTTSAKLFRDIQMHDWNHESHENRILMIIIFSGFSYFENHRLKYSRRFFIIFLTLLGRCHGSMFEQERQTASLHRFMGLPYILFFTSHKQPQQLKKHHCTSHKL